MLEFKVEFELELIEFVIVKLLELELVTKKFLIELFKDEERDISLVEGDSLSLLNN